MIYTNHMQHHQLTGTVTPFAGDGRSLGYPTANIMTHTDLTDGVYFGFANLGPYTRHPALIFVGIPTTMGQVERRVEAHLLDIPDQDYYGLKLELELIEYHRANRTFTSIEELQTAMRHDESVARAWFGDF